MSFYEASVNHSWTGLALMDCLYTGGAVMTPATVWFDVMLCLSLDRNVDFKRELSITRAHCTRALPGRLGRRGAGYSSNTLVIAHARSNKHVSILSTNKPHLLTPDFSFATLLVNELLRKLTGNLSKYTQPSPIETLRSGSLASIITRPPRGELS